MKSILIYLLRNLFFVEGAASWISEKVWGGRGRASHTGIALPAATPLREDSRIFWNVL